jgi:hypothetical protein
MQTLAFNEDKHFEIGVTTKKALIKDTKGLHDRARELAIHLFYGRHVCGTQPGAWLQAVKSWTHARRAGIPGPIRSKCDHCGLSH